ncbi:avidin/streptavidin family protein [Robiginitomaculum antarcticum]|uniref:avidin/streptavidin family protein n=1 Tax=Robiginitomaculum antarcticum TaxID=437507 RepID=UPI0003A04F2A|nr:avidin/streptavidin family protein [Robiginitomaculum antarcticum]
MISACASAQTVDKTDMFSGAWKNDRGSHVVIKNNDGLLSGYYQTNLGEPDKSAMFPLTGFAQGDQIAFTVNFKGYGSMTSWTGQLTEDENGPYIRTLWNLTRDIADEEEPDDMWNSITAGASDFRPSGE